MDKMHVIVGAGAVGSQAALQLAERGEQVRILGRRGTGAGGGGGGAYMGAIWVLWPGMGKPLLTGKRGYAPSPLDVPHSWTSITDVARTLITAAADERAFGQAWLVPTNPALTVRQLATRFAEVNGAPKAKLMAIPYPVMWTVGLFSPLVKGLRTTRYPFTKPFVIDASATTEMFGLEPTPMDEALREAAARLRGN